MRHFNSKWFLSVELELLPWWLVSRDGESTCNSTAKALGADPIPAKGGDVLTLLCSLKQYYLDPWTSQVWTAQSTDTQMFFTNYTLQYYMIHVWLNPTMQNPGCREPSHQVILGFSTGGWGGVRVGNPNRCVVQGSTVWASGEIN